MSSETMTRAGETKKGLSPLAWVGIGCGAIVVVGFVVSLALGAFLFKKGKQAVDEATGGESISAFVEGLKENPARVAAETAIRMNPDLELVETDDEEGTITFRNQRTREEITLDFEDIAEGRFAITTDEGEVTYSATGAEGGITVTGPQGETRFGAGLDLDDLPDWVPLYPDATETQSVFHSRTGTTVSGILGGKTVDGVEKVIEHYEGVFGEKGWEVTSQSVTTTQGGAFGVITGEHSGTGRSVNVSAVEGEGETQVTVNYSG